MSASVSAWIVTYLIHSTLLITAVWLAVRWIRSASVRDTLWKIALVGAVVTTTLQMTVPFERLLPRNAPARVTMELPPAPVAMTTPLRLGAQHNNIAAPAEKRGLDSYLPLAYAALLLLLLARLALGRNRFLAAVKDRVEVLVGPDRALLDRLCATARIQRPVRLTESAGVRSPVAMMGWEIVVPEVVFSRLTEEQRETILAHELGHLVRRDPHWLAVAEVLKAVLCFQPLNWVVQAKMKETAEFLCDDAAVLQTGNQKALVETLAELAAHAGPVTPAVAGMAEEGSNLIVRVTRVLRARPSAPLRLSVRVLIALFVVGITSVFAPGMVVGVVRASTRPIAVLAGAAKPVTKAILPAVSKVADVVMPVHPQRAREAMPAPMAEPVRAVEPVSSSYALFDQPGSTLTYYSEDGSQFIWFTAEAAEVATIGSDVRFTRPDGFVRAKLKSDDGTMREIRAIASATGAEFIYRIGDVEQPWNSEARYLLTQVLRGATNQYDGHPAAAARRGEKSCSTTAASSATATDSVAAAPARSRHTASGLWRVNVMFDRDCKGEKSSGQVHAERVNIDAAAGTVTFAGNAFLEVHEQTPTTDRSYRRDARGSTWEGRWTTDAEQQQWLIEMLRKADVPETIVAGLTR
ncbi:MAG: M48 family metalloprotease [Acidobacteriota bacterium]|nr:M48 family metalloprotease [Acidobacteriota bacterium]